jgi:DNA-binding beta-propeller fold protein YncE
MKKVTTLIVALLFMMPMISVSQDMEWFNEGPWPFLQDSVFTGATHGIAVDPDGKVWVQPFYTTGQFIDGQDTFNVTQIYVFTPEGEQVAFSPLQHVTVDETRYVFPPSNGRGLTADVNGNILASFASRLHLINYQTGEGMATVIPPDSTALNKAAVAMETGNVYTSHVLPGNKVNIYDSGLNFLETAIPEVLGFARAFEVSPDGNTVYWGSFSTHVLVEYKRDSEFDPFPEFPDTVLYGINPESFAWHPTTGHLWLSAGSVLNAPPNSGPEEFPETHWRPNVWYAFDVETWEVQDSLEWIFQRLPDTQDERPRAIDFSPDGNYAYIGCFDGANFSAVQRLVRQPVSVRPDDRLIADRFSLSQNYPNPFNPSTEIQFTVKEAGMVTLKVYDMLGREVATLVNEHLAVGGYSATFDATNLPSGAYVYSLESQGQRLTKKMMLLK